MVQNVNPTFVKTPNIAVTIFTSSGNVTTVAGSTLTTLYTGGVNGSKIISVIASNTSTSGLINAILTVGSTVSGAQVYYPINSVTLPSLTSGYDTVLVPSNLLATAWAPVDSDGNAFLFLASTAYTLSVGISSAIQTTGGRVTFIVEAGDF